MPEEKTGIRRKVDDFFTNYLRNTTTDQEILDFYGEGNIIGRKGIDKSNIVDQTYDAKNLPGWRPWVKRETPESDSLFGLSGGKQSIVDIPGAPDPITKNPWQMKFEALPFPGSGVPTSSATRFLKDFRVPIGTSVDYGFETAPNVSDVNKREIEAIVNDPRNYENMRAAVQAEDAGTSLSKSGPLRASWQEEIDRLSKRPSAVVRPSGELATPSWWEGRGYELPQDLKQSTLDTFKQQILQAEQPFGSVSQLTPVRESYDTVRPGGDVNWRANLYEKAGFAGPLTKVSIKTPYGETSDNVQLFTRGNERLLPIQPYTEFRDSFNASKPSALGTEPAPDFTPFQKAVGTRNYLIGRNILEGRGSLGAPVRIAKGAVPPKAVRSVVPKGFLLDAGINYALGMPAKESLVQAGQDIVSAYGIGQPQLAQVERRGDYFIDTRNNKILSSAVNPKEQFENMGVAQKNGQWVPVRRGTVAGEPSFSETVAAPFRAAGDVWKTRSNAAANQARYAWNQLTKGKIPWWGK